MSLLRKLKHFVAFGRQDVGGTRARTENDFKPGPGRDDESRSLIVESYKSALVRYPYSELRQDIP